MRRFLDLVVGETVVIDGRECVFDALIPSGQGHPNEPDDFYFLEKWTKRPVRLTFDQFNEFHEAGKLMRRREYENPADKVPFDDAPDMEKRKARKFVLEAFDESGLNKSEPAIRPFLEDLRKSFPFDLKYLPSPGHLIRLLRERGAKGDRRLRHMGNRHRSHGSRLNPVVKDILAKIVDEHASDFRKKPLDIYFLAFHATTRRNDDLVAQGLSALTPPSYSTVYRYLQHTDSYERSRKRDGEVAAKAKWEPIKGSMKAERILDVAIFDHTVVDCWVIDDEKGIPVGRPHLGVLLDVCSRYPLGYYIGFEEPSLHSVMASIKCGIREKSWIARKYPSIRGNWLAYGVPRKIVVDNAWESVGSSFIDACDDARIGIEWAPVRDPRYKAKVERFFGTLNTKLWHKLPGAVPYKPHVLKEYGIDPEKDAILLLSQMEAAFCQMIVEVYGREPHHGLGGKSPEQVWREREPIDLIPVVDNIADIEAAFGRVVDATLTREGVVVGGIPYHDPEIVRALLRELLPLESARNRKLGSVKIKAKVHPDNLSVLHVLNHKSFAYVALPCAQPEYARGITEHHHKVLKKWTASQNMEFQTESQRVEARMRLQGLIDSFVPVKIKHRRQLQRLTSGNDQNLGSAMPEALDASRKSSHELLIDAISDRADGRDRAKSSVRNRTGKAGRKTGQSPAKADVELLPQGNVQEQGNEALHFGEDQTVALLTAALEKVGMADNG